MAPRKPATRPTPPRPDQIDRVPTPRNPPAKPKPPARDRSTVRRDMESMPSYEQVRKTRPGLQPDELFYEYDQWFRNNPSAIEARRVADALGTIDPAYRDDILSIAWSWRFDETGDAIANQLENAGYLDLLERLRGGGPNRNRYGGGGGGMSKAEQYAQAEASIRNEVKSLGIGFDDASIKSLAKTAVDGRWSAEMVTDYVVAGAGDWSTVQDGQLKATVELVKQLGTRYLTPISDDTAREYASRLASGEMTNETVQMLIANQAKTVFSWLAPQIDQGMTVRDVLLPSRDLIAQELQVAPETVNLMDQKYQQMLRVTDNGQTRAATLDEVLKNVRSTAEWRKTGRARETASNAVMMLRQAFGSS